MGNNPNGTRINGRGHGACSYGDTARRVTKTVAFAKLLMPGAELRMGRCAAVPVVSGIGRSRCAANGYGVVGGLTGVEAESRQPLSHANRP